MANSFMRNLNKATNYTYTENGALTHKSTLNDLYDMFALGGAYRSRSDADCILLFKKAFEYDEKYALKCLFYLRDIRGGQGERRFFRVCLHWLGKTHPEAARRNLNLIPEYGRWDDLYEFVGTAVEKDAFQFMKQQFVLDLYSKTPSLLAKWLKSENTSSSTSRTFGNLTRNFFGMTAREYRKSLSVLRERINVLERLMSAGKWDEIEFDKIPSKAGIIYKNAFARHDVERMKLAKENVQSYADFAKDTTKKVNAGTLYPYDVVSKVTSRISRYYGYNGEDLEDTDRLMINKYWDNLTDYFNNATLNAICVIDTSGSMTWTSGSIKPIDVAISLGLYCAEHNSGPFANSYISFASRPQLIRTNGVDFCDKVARIYHTNLVDNTNIEAVFDLLLNIAKNTSTKKEDIPKSVVIISDMEFDAARTTSTGVGTLMERIAQKWKREGINMPQLIFWNVDARNDNIPMTVKEGVSFVSGASPVIFEMVMKGKTAFDLMYDKLDSERYAPIQ